MWLFLAVVLLVMVLGALWLRSHFLYQDVSDTLFDVVERVKELESLVGERDVTIANQRQIIADLRSVTHEEQIAHMHREGSRLVQVEIDKRLTLEKHYKSKVADLEQINAAQAEAIRELEGLRQPLVLQHVFGGES